MIFGQMILRFSTRLDQVVNITGTVFRFLETIYSRSAKPVYSYNI